MFNPITLTSIRGTLVGLIRTETGRMSSTQTKKTNGISQANVTALTDVENLKDVAVGQRMRTLLATDTVELVGSHSERMERIPTLKHKDRKDTLPSSLT